MWPPVVRCGVLLSTPPPRLCSGVTDGGLLLPSEAAAFPLPLHCWARVFTSSPRFSIPILSSSSFWIDLRSTPSDLKSSQSPSFHSFLPPLGKHASHLMLTGFQNGKIE